jgi:hypothetical protein
MGLVALSRDAGPVGTMTSGGTDVIEMPPSTSLPGTVVGVDVVVEGGGGRVLLDVGSVGMVVVASVCPSPPWRRSTAAWRPGAVDVGATAGNDALGAHPAATNKATTSAFDLTVPPPPRPTVVRWGRRSGAQRPRARFRRELRPQGGADVVARDAAHVVR